jgi:prevent-host-death family protein
MMPARSNVESARDDGVVEQIPIRALSQDTAGVLARVERGEVVEIIDRGLPIARIVPIRADSLADLVAAGVVLPPTTAGPIPMPQRIAELDRKHDE